MKNKNLTTITTLLFIALLTFTNCSISQNSEFILEDLGKKENKVQEITTDDINTIICQNEYSILFFYTTWCSSSIINLEKYIVNTLDTLNIKNKNLSIVIIGLAKEKKSIEELTKKYNINYTTYYLNSPIGSSIDKRVINKSLKKIFKGYKSVNMVPVGILCNNKFELLVEPDGYTFDSLIRLYYKQ